MNRRGFLGAILAAAAAPAIVRSGILMPVHEIIVPDWLHKTPEGVLSEAVEVMTRGTVQLEDGRVLTIGALREVMNEMWNAHLLPSPNRIIMPEQWQGKLYGIAIDGRRSV